MTPDELAALLKRATPRKHYPIAPPGTYVQYVGPHPPDAAVDTLRNVAPLLIDLWRAAEPLGDECGVRVGGNDWWRTLEAVRAAVRALADHTEEGTP